MIMTAQQFAERYMPPGWYLDARGTLCLNLGRYLLCVFQNSDDDELNITVDTLSPEGFYDCNVEWETPKTESEMMDLMGRFTLKYADRKDV